MYFKVIVVLLALVAVIPRAVADQYGIIELEDVTLSLREYQAGSRNAILDRGPLTNSRPNQGLSLQTYTNFFRYFYWKFNVEGITDSTQLQLFSWDSRLGVRLTEYLELEYGHAESNLLNYPIRYTTDFIGVNVLLFKAKPTNKGEFF